MPDDTRTELLDAIEADLAGVEAALERLEAGEYFTCEACGGPLTEEVLAAHPVSRRCAGCSARVDG